MLVSLEVTVAIAASAASRAGVEALVDTVRQARTASSCASFQSDPLTQQATDIVLRSVDTYLNHAARAVPVSDPLPTLHDLGSDASKATLIRTSGRNEAEAIQFIALAGYQKIPDCSFDRFGAAIKQNANSGLYIGAVVLAGQ